MGITRGTFRCARFHKVLYLVSTIVRKEKVSCRKILLHRQGSAKRFIQGDRAGL